MDSSSATVVRVYSVTGTPTPPLANPDPAMAERRSGAERTRIDIRCQAQTPDRPAGSHRCQLFAGHEGQHALMFCRQGHRTIRLWSHADPASVRERPAGQETLPWAPGLPTPAWSEIG